MMPVRWLTKRSRTRWSDLQVELLGGLDRHKLHRGALDRLSDCLRVAEVVLLSLRVGAHLLRRHQPCVIMHRDV